MHFTNTIKMIAFDADDTLWLNEVFYRGVEDSFTELLADFGTPDEVSAHLLEIERRNIPIYGFGAKPFMLSLIETAVTLTNGTIPASQIQQIIDLGKGMLTRPVQVLDGVEQVLAHLKSKYSLMVITKGDLLDQQSKLARSGLGQFFAHFEVVSNKKPETYREILTRYNLPLDQFVMVGNSLRSDILPVLENGGYAIHIPHGITWALEQVTESELNDKHYVQLESIRHMVDFLAQQESA